MKVCEYTNPRPRGYISPHFSNFHCLIFPGWLEYSFDTDSVLYCIDKVPIEVDVKLGECPSSARGPQIKLWNFYH